MEESLLGFAMEEPLQGLPMEELLQGLPMEELLQGLPMEELLQGLPMEGRPQQRNGIREHEFANLYSRIRIRESHVIFLM